jgi:hypothetical protein
MDGIRDTNEDETRYAYKILIGKPERKTPVGRHKLKNEYNIKIDLKQIECEDVNWIHLAQDRVQWRALVNTAMNLRVSSRAGNFLTS